MLKNFYRIACVIFGSIIVVSIVIASSTDENKNIEKQIFTQPLFEIKKIKKQNDAGKVIEEWTIYEFDAHGNRPAFHVSNVIYNLDKQVNNVIRSRPISMLQRTWRPDREEIAYFPNSQFALVHQNINEPIEQGKNQQYRLISVVTNPELEPIAILEWDDHILRPASKEVVDLYVKRVILKENKVPG